MTLETVGPEDYVETMDIELKTKDLSPEVREALDRVADSSESEGVRIVPIKDGYRLIPLTKTSERTAKGYRRKGPVRLGHKKHLGLKLED